ncbi:Uncharacterised protein [Kingella potus]|uniref:Lipoprotein n=1 Tax=Kingella potus TaxID=265175 RepID=A0A377R4Q1_9NEIS|nr:hypothetical protein [Kingella potus]STR03446.1 Uncharacterised protein [Kingella potus]
MKKSVLLFAAFFACAAAHADGGKSSAQAAEKNVSGQHGAASAVSQAQDAVRRYQKSEGAGSREILSEEAKLAPRERITGIVRFTAGRTYNIAGRCGSGCGNMSLKLYDSGVYLDLIDEDSINGLLVKQDPRTTKEPELSWKAEKNGRYTAVLTMKECAAASCAAALQIFEGTKALYSRHPYS